MCADVRSDRPPRIDPRNRATDLGTEETSQHADSRVVLQSPGRTAGPWLVRILPARLSGVGAGDLIVMTNSRTWPKTFEVARRSATSSISCWRDLGALSSPGQSARASLNDGAESLPHNPAGMARTRSTRSRASMIRSNPKADLPTGVAAFARFHASSSRSDSQSGCLRDTAGASLLRGAERSRLQPSPNYVVTTCFVMTRQVSGLPVTLAFDGLTAQILL